jgi:hypothetical protein
MSSTRLEDVFLIVQRYKPVAPVDCIARKEKKKAKNNASKDSPTGMSYWTLMTKQARKSRIMSAGSHIQILTKSFANAGSLTGNCSLSCALLDGCVLFVELGKNRLYISAIPLQTIRLLSQKIRH